MSTAAVKVDASFEEDITSQKKNSSYPPMLQQYLDYKVKYPDCLMLFQVGDFYELFFEDAVTVAKTLNLTLTSRDKNSPDPIPMCGVPISVVDNYTSRLVDARFSVAIVSQQVTYSPQGKQIVNRFLERIVTPGIKILGHVNKDHSESVIAAVYTQLETEFVLAFCNVQSGKIYIRDNIPYVNLVSELSRIQPLEIIIPGTIAKHKLDKRTSWIAEIERRLSGAAIKTRSLSADEYKDRDVSAISGYSILGTNAKKASQLLLRYIDETIVSGKINISSVTEEVYSGLLAMDSTSRRNLELVSNLKNGSSEATLFDFMNFTASPGGERLLRYSILNPLTEKAEIEKRQELVSELLSAYDFRRQTQTQLKFISDLERIAARLELQVILPREAASLRDSLHAAIEIGKVLKSGINNKEFKSETALNLCANLKVDNRLSDLLQNALMDNPEPTLMQGGIIREGYDTELDELRQLTKRGSSWIAELEATERQRTGISSLKIKYNNIIGYFIEITNANSSKVPDHFIRKQTTANTQRFTTNELRGREKELLGAESKQLELEKKLFENLRSQLKEFVNHIRSINQAISSLDMFCSFAECSERYDLTKPMIDNSNDLSIKSGKHPVLYKILKESYVPTSIDISGKNGSFILLTGPNMGGKSTYLRQTALITIMAQMGCYVPAEKAKIGIVDKIFARLGASDNQQEGESTFMVEMKEASHIIANATERSLLLIDEIGRGTATADGLAIAQSILEWIVNKISCRTLFATHFHELTSLENDHKSLANYSVGSFEKDGEVVFTHNIVKGAASSSYGIEVAKLAGLPEELLERARLTLSLHDQSGNPVGRKNSAQLSFFENTGQVSGHEKQELKELRKMKEEFLKVDINNLSPVMALNIIANIQEKNANKEK